jgi:hypothetical protein
MPHYTELQGIDDENIRMRTVAGLKRLRSGLRQAIPPRTLTSALLIATWNIRELDSGKYGFRGDEPYHYMAEIIGRFDLIAIQELRNGLYPLQRLRSLLGRAWGILVTDVTLGVAGNSERMAYLFDRRKVAFTGLAAELVLPKTRGAVAEPLQLARSPYLAGFRAGWAYFTLATVHIYYGRNQAAPPRRLAEITDLCRTLAAHAATLSGAPQRRPGAAPEPGNLIMLGDFNIFNRDDISMQAIADAGFHIPTALQRLPGSNVAGDKFYDQIAYLPPLAHMQSDGRAGVFDFFDHVYRLEDEREYAEERAGRPGQSFKEWRTYRMSDHLPMWIEFGIDDADAFLDSLA